jgi:hypothetical protein
MSRMDDIRVMRVKLKELVREHAIAKVRVTLRRHRLFICYIPPPSSYPSHVS